MLCYTFIMKNLLVTIIFLFFLAPWKPCLADGVALESLYGQDLLTAPASARLKFQNETGFSWYDVTAASRKDFLLKWEDSRKAAIEAKTAQDKERAKLEKSTAAAERARQKKANEIAKIEENRVKALANEKRVRDKQISDMKKKREKELRELKRQQKSRTQKTH